MPLNCLVPRYRCGLNDALSQLGLKKRFLGTAIWFYKDRGEFDGSFGGTMVKLLVRDKESIQEAVRRFRKLVERSGIKKEMRRREYYEKPSETKRRARLRAERRSKRNRMLAKR